MPEGRRVSAVVWLALDGVGHPDDAPVKGSPWDQSLPTLRPLVGAGRALDAALGVPGLPQSGTGQACWLTGQDAVRVMGEHFGPQPGPTLQRLLRAHSLPARLAGTGARAALVNHYAPEYAASGASGRNRLGCFPYAFRSAGWPLNPPGVPLLGATLGLEYRAPWPRTRPLTELTRAGQALAHAAPDWDLLVADLWFGDLLGHQGRPDTPPAVALAAREYLRGVDALLTGLLDAGARVVLSSDHGNLEDVQVKAHTLARVPFAGQGVDLGAPNDIVQGGAVIAGWFGLAPVTP